MKKGSKVLLALLVSLMVLLGRTPVALASESDPSASVHILSLVGSDAILLCSDGHYGLVDCSESDDYPDGSDPRYPINEGTTIGMGTWDKVRSYLDSQGVKQLDFFIGTHPHSDHIGNAPQIIERYKPKWVYTPVYDESMLDKKAGRWDNQYVYDRMLEAAEKQGCYIIQHYDAALPARSQDPTPDEIKLAEDKHMSSPKFYFGDSVIELFNYDVDKLRKPLYDGNALSLGVKLTCGERSAFLAGDISNIQGTENAIKDGVGKVDLLKMGHHGGLESSTPPFLMKLHPEYAAITNHPYILMRNVFQALTDIHATLFSAAEAQEAGIPAMVFKFKDNKVTHNDIPISPTFGWGSDGVCKAYIAGEPVVLNGWYQSFGQSYYFDNSNSSCVGFKKIDGKDYYFDKSGALKYGWVKEDGKWCYVDSQGQKKTGWLKDGNSWYYLDSTGTMTTGWLQNNGKWYYFDEYGVMQVGKIFDGQHYYYLDATGAMVNTGWVRDGSKWYYCGGSGALATGWVSSGNTWYYMNKDGVMQTGWVNDGNHTYYLNASGAMQTGWLRYNDKWYYLGGSGARATGWVSSGNTWYYMNKDGVMQTGWANDGKHDYYFNGSGAMQTGWIYYNSHWYFLDGSGAKRTGWVNTGGAWYYLDENGVMVTGSAKIDNRSYSFASSGAWIGYL